MNYIISLNRDQIEIIEDALEYQYEMIHECEEEHKFNMDVVYDIQQQISEQD